MTCSTPVLMVDHNVSCRHFNLKYARATILCLFLRFSVREEHSTGI